MERNGLFITFEGLEGAGKSTQAHRLFQTLDLAGFPVVISREPGGTPIGEVVRELLINPNYSEMDPLTETLLFAASRRQHVRQFILPKLEQGYVVICDRFCDATTAYQSFGNGVPLKDVEEINAMCAWGATPDITVYLDIAVEDGLQRVRQRYANNGGALDRLENLGYSFFERVAEGYKYAIDRDRERFVIVDGNCDEDEVSQAILQALHPSLEEMFPKECSNLDLFGV